MSTSQAAAVHVVPFIARLVLCAAFLPAGYAKLFTHESITAAERGRLEAMGWSWTPPEASAADGAGGASRADVPAPAAGTVEISSSDAPPTTAEAPTIRRLEKLAFLTANAGLPAPRLTAWLVAITEFLGGILILIGLLSRLCALGLAAVMCGAIFLTSLPSLRAHPFLIGMPAEPLQHFTLQAALLALALGVLLAGPGCFSADHVIFGRKHAERAAPRAGGSGGA